MVQFGLAMGKRPRPRGAACESPEADFERTAVQHMWIVSADTQLDVDSRDHGLSLDPPMGLRVEA